MTKMQMFIPAIAGVAFGVVAECSGAEASSTPTAVWVKPEESLQWKTVMSASAPVALDWPSGAMSASLTVTADGAVVGSSTISDTTATEAPFPASLPSEYGEERVVTVTVEYLDGLDATIETSSARLGLVTGVGGNATRCVTSTSEKAWTTVKNHAVVPIPEDTTALTVDSVAQTFDAPGWWEWSRIGIESHTLVLTTDSGESLATVKGLGSGVILIVF